MEQQETQYIKKIIVTLVTIFVSFLAFNGTPAHSRSEADVAAIAHRILQAENSDSYQIIGLSKEELAGLSQTDFEVTIKKAFLHLFKLFHPDVSSHPQSTLISQKVSQAKNNLLKEKRVKPTHQPKPESPTDQVLRSNFIGKVRSLLAANYQDKEEAYKRVTELIQLSRSYLKTQHPTDPEWRATWKEAFNYKDGLHPLNLKISESPLVYLSFALFLVKEPSLSDGVKFDIAYMIYELSHYWLMGPSSHEPLGIMEQLLDEAMESTRLHVRWEGAKKKLLIEKFNRCELHLTSNPYDASSRQREGSWKF